MSPASFPMALLAAALAAGDVPRSDGPAPSARPDLQQIHSSRKARRFPPRTLPRRSSKPSPDWSPPGSAGRMKGFPTSASGFLGTKARLDATRRGGEVGPKGKSACRAGTLSSFNPRRGCFWLFYKAGPTPALELVGHVDLVERALTLARPGRSPEQTPRRLPRAGLHSEQADLRSRTVPILSPTSFREDQGWPDPFRDGRPTSARPGRPSGLSTTIKPGRRSSRPYSPTPMAASRPALSRSQQGKVLSEYTRVCGRRQELDDSSSATPHSPTPTPASTPSPSADGRHLLMSTTPQRRAAARAHRGKSRPMARPWKTAMVLRRPAQANTRTPP